jgi:nitrite reductase/ring-hydroxylating ferredoxin subunit
MSWVTVASTSDFEGEVQKLIVEIEGRSVGIFRENDSWHAVLNHCPHSGAPVCEGRVTGRVVCTASGQSTYDSSLRTLRCPWHHWEFDLETGKAVANVRERLKIYPVRIQEGDVQIDA